MEWKEAKWLKFSVFMSDVTALIVLCELSFRILYSTFAFKLTVSTWIYVSLFCLSDNLFHSVQSDGNTDAACA